MNKNHKDRGGGHNDHVDVYKDCAVTRHTDEELSHTDLERKSHIDEGLKDFKFPKKPKDLDF